MLEKITEEELLFMESWYDPICQAETLFSDFDNLGMMEGEKLSHVRLGQLPLISYEYLIDSEDPNLTGRENFELRKGVGDIYCLGGRLFGKTLIVEKIDLMVSMIILKVEKVGFSSYDARHIEGVLDEVLFAIENHPFFRLYEPRTKRNPYTVNLKTGYSMIGVNMNITGQKPGSQFFQKHFTRLYIEEASFETEEVYSKRRDSVSEVGCIFRIAGMTDFTKHSPCGRVFDRLELQPWVCNLPQYINPNWNDAEKQKAIKDFNGEQTVEFRIFIKGEVVTDAISAFDMQRIRPQYNRTRQIKSLEIGKDLYYIFKQRLIVERPSNATNVWMAADIGESAPTEIGIFFEINKKYRYVYNITLYNLTDKEQFKIFKYLAEEVKANFIGLDCTDGTGRAIFRSLEEIFPKSNLNWVSFNEKIAIDYEKKRTEEGQEIIALKNGKPIEKMEYVSEWSIKRLQHLLYGEKFDLPLDYKFDKQFDSVRTFKSGNRVMYKPMVKDDHVFQMFQVFSIMQWDREWSINKPIKKLTFCKSGV